LTGSGVESKRERTKKLNYLSTQSKGEWQAYIKEKTILGEAEFDNRNPMPSISAEAKPHPRYGGGRGLWGPQATGLMPESTSIED
jgi:hypothetical protein